MSSFVLVRSKVIDPDGYAAYRELAGPSVRAHGGSIVLKGAVVETLEGDDFAEQVAVLQFPNADAARSCFASDAYAAARRARAEAGPMMLTLFAG